MSGISRLSLTFLGTSSGGGPTSSRACSAISLNIHDHASSQHWLVDCAEGTQRQILKTSSPHVRYTNIRKILITHMHVDHCMGVVPLMRHILPSYMRKIVPAPSTRRDAKPRLELYGPAGLRNFIRQNLFATHMSLSHYYAVHELLTPSDAPTPNHSHLLHPNEAVGENIHSDATGIWRDFFPGDEPMQVDAGPLVHRIPAIGYVFTEKQSLENPEEPEFASRARRKVVILGDTCDPWQMKDIAMDPSILVHEATSSWQPTELIDTYNRLFRRSRKTQSQRADTAKQRHAVRDALRGEPDVGEEYKRLLKPFEPLQALSQGIEKGSDSTANELHMDHLPASSLDEFWNKTEETLSAQLTSDVKVEEGRDQGNTDIMPLQRDLKDATAQSPEQSVLTPEEVQERAVARGHSTPEMAGAFAKHIRARKLFLNHLSSWYPAPDLSPNIKSKERSLKRDLLVRINAEIERQATKAWANPHRQSAVAARDLMRVSVDPVNV